MRLYQFYGTVVSIFNRLGVYGCVQEMEFGDNKHLSSSTNTNGWIHGSNPLNFVKQNWNLLLNVLKLRPFLRDLKHIKEIAFELSFIKYLLGRVLLP